MNQAHSGGYGVGGFDALEAFKAWQLFRDPHARWCDVPGAERLAQLSVVNPHDQRLTELAGLVHTTQMARYAGSDNPYWANYPPREQFVNHVPGCIPLIAMPTGGVLQLPGSDLCRNVCLIGSTGGGKTSMLRFLIYWILRIIPNALIVAFDRKGGELVDCASLQRAGMPVNVLNWSEMQIALLQPIIGMRQASFVAVMVQLFASVLNLFASRRLQSETLKLLFNRSRPHGQWPRFSEWIDVIDKVRVSPASRLGQYKEATLAALTAVFNELGEQLDYASSTFFDELYRRSGCIVISTAGLSVEAESLLACLFITTPALII
jgi:hypothetical protein